MMSLFYKYGTINLGNGSLDVKRNKITGSITLLLSSHTTKQLFKENKKVENTEQKENNQ